MTSYINFKYNYTDTIIVTLYLPFCINISMNDIYSIIFLLYYCTNVAIV